MFRRGVLISGHDLLSRLRLKPLSSSSGFEASAWGRASIMTDSDRARHADCIHMVRTWPPPNPPQGPLPQLTLLAEVADSRAREPGVVTPPALSDAPRAPHARHSTAIGGGGGGGRGGERGSAACLVCGGGHNVHVKLRAKARCSLRGGVASHAFMQRAGPPPLPGTPSSCRADTAQASTEPADDPASATTARLTHKSCRDALHGCFEPRNAEGRRNGRLADVGTGRLY